MVQDQLYVQNIELAAFCTEFRQLAQKFSQNEKVIRGLAVSGANLHEVLWCRYLLLLLTGICILLCR